MFRILYVLLNPYNAIKAQYKEFRERKCNIYNKRMKAIIHNDELANADKRDVLLSLCTEMKNKYEWLFNYKRYSRIFDRTVRYADKYNTYANRKCTMDVDW